MRNSNFDNNTLLANLSFSSANTWVEKDITSIAGYKYLIIHVSNPSNIILNPIFIPTKFFKITNSASFISLRVAVNVSTVVEYDIYYISDTKVKVYPTNTTLTVRIQGIK